MINTQRLLISFSNNKFTAWTANIKSPAFQESPRQATNSGDNGWLTPARHQHYGPGESLPWLSSKRSTPRQQMQGHTSFLRGDEGPGGTIKGLPGCLPQRHQFEPSDNPRAKQHLRIDAWEQGLGGSLLKTGWAGPLEIPLHLRRRKLINCLEFLACVVQTMLSIAEDDPAAGYCLTSQTGKVVGL